MAGGDALGPGLIGIGTGIVTALCAVIGKLWAALVSERRERAAEVAELRHELAEANARIVELQREANERGDVFQREHVRDLRRIAGLASLEPGRPSPWPPVIVDRRDVPIIRAGPGKPLPPPRKGRG